MELSATKRKWWTVSIPLGILILNIIYKILFLGARDITLDESFTLFHSQMPWREILSMLPAPPAILFKKYIIDGY